MTAKHPDDQPTVELSEDVLRWASETHSNRQPDPAEAEVLRVELGDRATNAMGTPIHRRPPKP